MINPNIDWIKFQNNYLFLSRFGNNVTNATWEDFWLNEGFTKFGESLIKMSETFSKLLFVLVQLRCLILIPKFTIINQSFKFNVNNGFVAWFKVASCVMFTTARNSKISPSKTASRLWKVPWKLSAPHTNLPSWSQTWKVRDIQDVDHFNLEI